MSACEKCDLTPCACRWIIQLGRGGNWEWRRSEALRMWDEPLPIVNGQPTYHYSTCPCPPCWSLAQSTYENFPNVIPLPMPPDKPVQAVENRKATQ